MQMQCDLLQEGLAPGVNMLGEAGGQLTDVKLVLVYL